MQKTLCFSELNSQLEILIHLEMVNDIFMHLVPKLPQSNTKRDIFMFLCLEQEIFLFCVFSLPTAHTSASSKWNALFHAFEAHIIFLFRLELTDNHRLHWQLKKIHCLHACPFDYESLPKHNLTKCRFYKEKTLQWSINDYFQSFSLCLAILETQQLHWFVAMSTEIWVWLELLNVN